MVRITITTHATTLNFAADIATLSRMTGKDFSGPTPEIRAPTPLRMPDTPQEGDANLTADAAVKQQETPVVVGDVEILGNVEELSKEDVETPSLS